MMMMMMIGGFLLLLHRDEMRMTESGCWRSERWEGGVGVMLLLGENGKLV